MFVLIGILVLFFLAICFLIVFKNNYSNFIFFNLIKIVFSCILVFIILVKVISFLNANTKVTVGKIYGNYIIDRNKYPGKQADWQYNHYRFKITEDNKIFFYITEKENIIKTIEGKVEFTEYGHSPHLKIELEEPKFHILQENPTLYREIWSFYYVFESDKYKNVFFTKGNWKSID
jgi:hypothetical protein